MTQKTLGHAIQSLCPNLEIPDEAAGALCSVVMNAVSGVIKDANSLALNSKRTVVDMPDINLALQLHGFEPIYGSSRFRERDWLWAMGSRSVFFGQDKEHLTSKLGNSTLPHPPVDVSVMPHWLAIDGVQPDIPENRATTIKRQKRTDDMHNNPAEKKSGLKFVLNGMIDGNIELSLPVVHVLSEEQQKCFRQIQSTVESSGPSEGMGNLKVLEGLSEDAALQPLVPYLVRYVTHQIHAHLQETGVLHRCLHLIANLAKNPNLELERYGHQLLPSVLSCLLGSDVGCPGTEDGWELRKLAAIVTQLSIAVFGNALNDLHARVARELCKCLETTDKPLETQYGAIVGLSELSATSAPSVADVLKAVSKRLEEKIADLDQTNKEYQKIIKCQSALHGGVEQKASLSPDFVIDEDDFGKAIEAGIEMEELEDLID